MLEGQAYVGSGYLAVLAALLIIAGALADRYGRRRIFIIGLAAFGIGPSSAASRRRLEFLIVARLLQGAAGALLVPGSLAIITAAFRAPAGRGRSACGRPRRPPLTLLGPILGGLLVDNLTWRLAFLINVPLVAVALWAAIRHVEESRDPDATGHFDWLGSIVGSSRSAASRSGRSTARRPTGRTPSPGSPSRSAPCASSRSRSSWRVRPHPLVPLSLFRNRDFAAINLATFLIYGALYVSFTYTALLYQGTLGYSATGAAIIGLPAGILLATLRPGSAA